MEQIGGDAQQVVEIHGVGHQQPVLVLAIDLGYAVLAQGLGPRGEGLEVDQLPLGGADDRVHPPGRKALGVEIEVPDHISSEAHRVSLVVDAERGPVPEHTRVYPKDPNARRMKGGHPHPPCNRPHQRHQALAHLVRGLVGEGDGQYLGRGHPVGHQPGNAVGKHPGLARAGPSDDEQRAAAVAHRTALLGVEPVQQVRSEHRGGHDSHPTCDLCPRRG